MTINHGSDNYSAEELERINQELSAKAQISLLKHLELIPSDELNAKLSAKAQLDLLIYLGIYPCGQ